MTTVRIAAVVLVLAALLGLAYAQASRPGQAAPPDAGLAPTFVRATNNSYGQTTVSVAARILDITRIQEIAGEMAAVVELTLHWNDPRQRFDPLKQGSARKEFSGRTALAELEKMWNPAATIRNMVGSPRSDEVGLIVEATGDVTLVRTIDGIFRVGLDMSRFPFDHEQLPIEIASSRYPEEDVVFVHEAKDDALSTATPRPRAVGWTLGGVSFQTGTFIGWNGDTRSLVTTRIAASRVPLKYVMRSFIPFAMIMMCSLFVLWSPDTNYFSKGTMIFSALLALVALSFSLEANFPGSISMATPVAALITTGFLYLVLALVLNMIAMNPEASWAKQHSFVAAEVRALIKWAVPLTVVIIWTSMVLQAVV